jgi:hypothetical protein
MVALKPKLLVAGVFGATVKESFTARVAEGLTV